jgi:glycosyltransferase involved in cell wall biosynthesis
LLTRGAESRTLPTDMPMRTAENISFPVGVAYVLPGLGRGGTEKHVLDLASRLDRHRFEPCVISTAGGGAMEEELTGRGIPVRILDYRGLSLHPSRALPLSGEARAFFRSFARILTEYRVSVLHTYLPAANVLGMAAAVRHRTRVRIVSKRALCRYKEGHFVYSVFEDLANLAADAVMVNSRAVAEDVRRSERFVEGKMFLVHNGVDIPGNTAGGGRPPIPPDLRLPAGTLPIACIANLHAYKGHKDLVDGASLVVKTFPQARFLLVGRDGGEGEALRRRIANQGLEGKVLLTGPRTDVDVILAASEFVVHPSHEEGFSNVILEAMGAGKAVVATRVGGNPEAVVDGRTGLLVPPGESDALASAILELLRDPERAVTMGRAGMERARDLFPLEAMVTAVEETYLRLLEGGIPSHRV